MPGGNGNGQKDGVVSVKMSSDAVGARDFRLSGRAALLAGLLSWQGCSPGWETICCAGRKYHSCERIKVTRKLS